MSSYPPPSSRLPIYNPSVFDYTTSADGGITLSTADGRYVSLTKTQAINGVKTFTSAPIMSSISNTGTLTLPTTTGTLALTSQIPTNANYVDLSTNQNIAGQKTFTANTYLDGSTSTVSSLTGTLVVKNISNTSNQLGLQSTANGFNYVAWFQCKNTASDSVFLTPEFSGSDTLVVTNLAQTLTNKTLTAPVISTISNSGTITLPTGTRTLVARDTTDTLTNKTMGTLQVGANGTSSSEIRYGSSTVGALSAGAGTTVSISFSPAFSSTPTLYASIQSASGINAHNCITVSFGGASTTGATLYASNFTAFNTTGTATIAWFARV